MSEFKLTTREKNGVIVLNTEGYLNNFGGDRIASECLQKISEGKRKFLINFEKTEMVNSIGVSILIEVIEELQGVNGKIGYCNLAPIIEKTFNIMGITKYSKVYTTEDEGLQAMDE
ncbi:MAG: STAS domain-containing protein [Candidatus Marinimicrobia bacterium]|nr:STAS domain-containing protein [Candidatus Neomarinimicrobiota bacterium]